MADSKRETAVNALKTRLQTITTGNGYETDIGSNVKIYFPAEIELDDDTLPLVNIKDGDTDISLFDDDLGPITIGKERQRINMSIHIRMAEGTNTAVYLRKAIADVYKAIGTDRRLGGAVFEIFPSSHTMGVTQTDRVIGSADIVLSVFLETGLFNPYS